MATPRLSKADHAKIMERLGGDLEIAEALGLVAYWGHDTSSPSGRGKAVKAVREPEIFDEEEEAIRLRYRGSTNSPLFYKGFNNFNSMGRFV